MVLPGWNVSEPVQLTIKLYKVIEALKNAPGEAKAFISKLDDFRCSLEALQQTMEGDVETRFPSQDLDHLRVTLSNCQGCVKRCEEFSKQFRTLTRDGNGPFTSAGPRLWLVWHEKKADKLAAEIDSQVNKITFSLLIKFRSVFISRFPVKAMRFSVLTVNSHDGQSRRGSAAASPGTGFTSPSRTGTAGSLPPYSSSPSSLRPSQNTSNQRAKTPPDWLGLNNDPQKEMKPGTDLTSGKFKFLLGEDEGENKAFQSPESSPRAKRCSKALPDLPERDEDVLGASVSRPGTGTEVAAGSPESLKLFGSPPESSRRDSRNTNSLPSHSTKGSRRSSVAVTTSLDSRPGTTVGLGPAVLEAAMDNLHGVRVFVFPSIIQ